MMLTDIELSEIFDDDREPGDPRSVSNDEVDNCAEPTIGIDALDGNRVLEAAEGDGGCDLAGDCVGADNSREFASADELAEQTGGENEINGFSEPTLAREDSITIEEIYETPEESFDCTEFDITLPPAPPVKPSRRPRKQPPTFGL